MLYCGGKKLLCVLTVLHCGVTCSNAVLQFPTVVSVCATMVSKCSTVI